MHEKNKIKMNGLIYEFLSYHILEVFEQRQNYLSGISLWEFLY